MEIKACFSCASPGIKKTLLYDDYSNHAGQPDCDRIRCSNNDCEISMFLFTIEAWNRRTDPIKDQMLKALKLALRKSRFPHLWGYAVEQAVKTCEEEINC